ncbi:hypothetical protein [Cytobacillus sp. IB215665]|uniref:hypothetical protein n=1 Tax=Cytobacillus sp. IB215665 TaxID=3097357 RepID=UPI002A0CF555|nr:hypothetical protein [Cytobacillus sp. IB215665]MDX8367110.1 hypothetical protein [Cytobacillus sp. IB215665]
MELVNKNDLNSFVLQNVEVAIFDDQDDDKAPFVPKIIQKTALCPDETHLRIYFDHMNFFAVPLSSSVNKHDNEWKAFDSEHALYYVIRKVSD